VSHVLRTSAHLIINMRLTSIQIPPCATVAELQTRLVVAFNQLVDSLNVPAQSAIDAKGNRVTNVAAPSASGDAINLAYLQDKVKPIEEINRKLGLLNRTLSSSTASSNLIWAIRSESTNYNVAAGDITILVDCTTGNVTITLPASPDNGRVVIVKNLVALNTLTISPNGNTIDGAVSLTTSTAGARFMLQYFAATTDWKIIT